MTTPPQPGAPAGPPGKKKGGLLAWAKKNPGLAAGGAAGAGLLGIVLLRRNAANAPGDLAPDTTGAAGTTATDSGGTGSVPASFADTGTDPFGSIENQITGLQNQLNTVTATQNPPPGVNIYQWAKAILQKRGIKNPTKAQINKERSVLINLGATPAKKPPAPKKGKPPTRKKK